MSNFGARIGEFVLVHPEAGYSAQVDQRHIQIAEAKIPPDYLTVIAILASLLPPF